MADIHALLLKAVAAQQRGSLDEAGDAYRAVLAADPQQFDALHLLGVIAAQRQDFAGAADLIARAVMVNPNHAGAHYNLAYVYEDLRQYEVAIASYGRAIALKPDHALAYNNRGLALAALKRHSEAIASFDASLAIDPNAVATWQNRGVVASNAGRLEEAAANFDRVLEFNPTDADAVLARAMIRREIKNSTGALADCDRALALRPDDAAFHAARGAVLTDLHRHQDALACYDAALRLRPDFAEAQTNRGLALAALGDAKAALESFEQAIRCNPDLAAAHYNKGMHLSARGEHAAALACFDRAFALAPEHDYLFGQRLFTRMRLCDWRNFARDTAEMTARIMRGERAAPAFIALAFTDSPALHRRAAEIQTAAEYPPNPALGPIPPRAASAKTRLGYFSMDFRLHPVAQLTTGLFEAHDRSCFEVHAFSYGPDTGDALRRRLEKGFDHFHDVRAKTDAEIATFARERGIDIAIDLAGHTMDSRGGIFALRAAPVQVGYIGYPATMGAKYIDYIIADGMVLPGDAEISEKIVRLPWFQVNDGSRADVDRPYTRAELGLPEGRFIYCCFNNAYKITPVVFDSWMRILSRVPGSVLLLAADTPEAVRNLRCEAAARGVDPVRLVFAPRVGLPEYLGRSRAADLFLDTTPFNAHTTAGDALWAGLPVLTLLGQAYSGRVAASLLKTVGLAELITTTPAAYEDLAVALAGDVERLAGLKEKLARRDSPLFDAKAFAGYIETAYAQMMARHHAGLPPDHIEIAR